MSRTFKSVDHEAALDLSVRLGECLPPAHLARFVVECSALLDLAPLYARDGARGGEAYAPEVLLGLVFYGYATRSPCLWPISSRWPTAATCRPV